MLGAAARADPVVLVFQLNANHRAAVGPHQIRHLLTDLPVEARDLGKVSRRVAAQFADTDQPIRKAAVARLRMHPRAGAQIDVEPRGGGKLHETAQVARTGPVEHAALGLVVIPEDIARDDADATGAHLAQFHLPLVGRVARVVELAHHRQPGLAIQLDIAAVHGQAPRGGLVVPEVQKVALHGSEVGRKAERDRRGHVFG